MAALAQVEIKFTKTTEDWLRRELGGKFNDFKDSLGSGKTTKEFEPLQKLLKRDQNRELYLDNDSIALYRGFSQSKSVVPKRVSAEKPEGPQGRIQKALEDMARVNKRMVELNTGVAKYYIRNDASITQAKKRELLGLADKYVALTGMTPKYLTGEKKPTSEDMAALSSAQSELGKYFKLAEQAMAKAVQQHVTLRM